MNTAYIGIGSNLGDKRLNCLKAIKMIEQIPGCELTGRSDLYLTKPVGVKGQDWYVNGVASISTRRTAQNLLKGLLAVEKHMGRVRREQWAPRIIDLDILIFGEEIISEEYLKVPHPLLHLRRFVLVPLAQVAPNLIHPSLAVTIAELLRKFQEDGQIVTPIKE
ncbi:MAG: 2-amino-4-hydroxy-6-hydroxymethyldihydropteridine diphosphokinase [Deltaproteobacteria bacterium]|nr:2-amino-4-hydroxy-6-hydroxymethyldihydropteridine diphosphokinase [Deltaproteobacteria bacterium]